MQPALAIRSDRIDNYLLLQKNSRVSLLVRYTGRYHIIAVNNKLDNEKEENVLAGNCSDAMIDEMGLTRETILKTDLHGVAIGGCCAGDVVVLYTKDRKLKYVLSDDYDDEYLNAMFAGIECFQPPKNVKAKSHKSDWRTELQVESMRKVIGTIGSVLNFSGCVCFVATSLFGRLSALWSIICLLIMVTSIGLYFAYPQYFSVMGGKEYKRVGYTAKVKHLDFAIMAPALALTFRSLSDFCFPNWTPLLIAGVVVGFAVSVIMYIFSREVPLNGSVFCWIWALRLRCAVVDGVIVRSRFVLSFKASYAS